MSDYKHYRLEKEPQGPTYIGLLHYALKHCSTALFVRRDSLAVSAEARVIIARVRPLLVSQTQERAWPGTELLSATATVFQLRFDADTVEQFSQATDRLFGWQQPDLPEDLCLLRPDSVPWLVTIAHEGDAYLVLTPTEWAVLIAALPDLAAYPEQ